MEELTILNCLCQARTQSSCHQDIPLLPCWYVKCTSCPNTVELSKHSGVSQTLTLLRESYWVLKGRQLTCKVIRSCVVCRRIEGPPYTSGPSPDLPAKRVSEDPPFSYTGVDFAGPLYVNSSLGHSEKAYVCLFTCASTRAVHLEMTHDISVEGFLLALH